MRIAFFGGSFDPPHAGHIAIARAAVDRLQLDRVLVAPVGRQPLKGATAWAGFEDRLAMVRLACAQQAGSGGPSLTASDADAPSADGSPNYTYDVLLRVRDGLAAGDRLFCLLGADSFHTLRHWHRAAALLGLCDFIVAARPGYDLTHVRDGLPDGVAVLSRVERDGLVELRLSTGSTLYAMLDTDEDVSATRLREALQQGLTGENTAAEGLLAPGVAEYIRARGLYRQG